MDDNTTKRDNMSKLTKAGIATIAATARELGTQDPEVLRQALVPKMSREHWATLLASAGVLS